MDVRNIHARRLYIIETLRGCAIDFYEYVVDSFIHVGIHVKVSQQQKIASAANHCPVRSDAVNYTMYRIALVKGLQ